MGLQTGESVGCQVTEVQALQDPSSQAGQQRRIERAQKAGWGLRGVRKKSCPLSQGLRELVRGYNWEGPERASVISPEYLCWRMNQGLSFNQEPVARDTEPGSVKERRERIGKSRYC